MTEKNSKVPIAILSCFLIAFILQGVLKLSGILVFEKALDWEIFSVIDKHKSLQIIFNSLIMLINVYCMSFAFTTKPYSNKWWHYILLIVTCFGITALRLLVTLNFTQQILLDIVVYVLMPLVINFTIDKENRLFQKDVFDFVTTTSLQIVIYFCYLGLSYWSGVLNSMIAINPIYVLSSSMFLIKTEIYIGMVTFMLSINLMIVNIKRRENMHLPVDIATDEAKVKELQEKKAKKDSKKNGK